jgi:hypothetical protein
MKTAFIAAVLTASTSLVYAGFIADGNELLENLNGNTSDQWYATGYISGTVDEAMSAKKPGVKSNWCFALPRVTNKQTADVVRLWLKKNPSKRHYNAPGLVSAALAESYPCKPGQP